MCRTPQAERCRPLHGRLRASALRLRPKSELFNLIISSCRIALRKERKQWRPLPNRHSRCVIAQRALVSALAAFRRARSFGAFGSSQKKENVRQKQPILISSTSRTSDWVSPARSGFTTFCHQKVAPKVSAGHFVGIGRRFSLSGYKRLHCCGAKDCTASTVAARQSPQAASALACCPSFCTPAPGARTSVRSVSSSGAMRRQLCAVRNDNHSFASAHGRSPACRTALRKERKDSYAPLHSVRNDKSCHPQEKVQTNSDTGINPCIAPQTAEKKAVSDRFSAHLPENRKIIRNFAGQSINCRARI